MNEIYDVLEICLQEIENGVDLEAVLGRYPDLDAELRPVLKASIVARNRVTTDPSPEAVRRGRAKLLQRAAQMREAKAAPRKRMIPLFQRLAISFTLAAIFLGSGTGLVSASSSALPGENLYPVKLTWENVRLFLTFNEESRETLEHSFENERLHEVNELFAERKKETIQFSGIYNNVNGVAYVSGIRITILSSSKLPTGPLIDGAAVLVTGHTNVQGYVDVESIEMLPAGTVVPTGEPAELDSEDNPTSSNGSSSINESESGNRGDGGEDKIGKQEQSESVTGNSGSDDSGGSNSSGDNISQSGKSDGKDNHGGGDNSGSGGGGESGSDDNSGSGGGED